MNTLGPEPSARNNQEIEAIKTFLLKNFETFNYYFWVFLGKISTFIKLKNLTVSGSIFLILVMWNIGSCDWSVGEFGLDGRGPGQSDLQRGALIEDFEGSTNGGNFGNRLPRAVFLWTGLVELNFLEDQFVVTVDQQTLIVLIVNRQLAAENAFLQISLHRCTIGYFALFEGWFRWRIKNKKSWNFCFWT